MQLLDFLSENPLAFALITTVIGLIIGSFLNVVIYRLPKMMELEWKTQCRLLLEESDGFNSGKLKEPDNPEQKSFNLLFPNSHCPNCNNEIKPWDNIPVFSYLFLKGQCRHCQTKIPLRYPAIEIATGILSAIVAFKFGPGWQCLAILFLTWALITLSLIDFDHMLLPDEITLLFLWIGLVINLKGLFVPLDQAVIGACLGYLSLWSFYWLFKIITGKEGMGYGDFKLLALLGAWMGWQLLPLIIVLSSIVGAMVGICLILFMGRDKKIPIPFGPYLAAAGWIAILWGDTIMTSYLSTSGL